jgi:hypothetical protein
MQLSRAEETSREGAGPPPVLLLGQGLLPPRLPAAMGRGNKEEESLFG